MFRKIEIKIFLAAFLLSLAVFSFVFAVGLPLVYEHRFVSVRLSSPYVANFLYSMSLYFVIAGALSVAVYLFVRHMRAESKIFIITFVTAFWAAVGTLVTVSMYWGNVSFRLLNPLGIITMWGDWFVQLVFLLLDVAFLMISAFAVLGYEMYKVAKKTLKQKDSD